MRVKQHHAASVLFALSALSFAGIWGIYLFVAVPERQGLLEHISSLLSYSFSEAGAQWFFVFLATMPLVFVLLSVVAWRAPASTWHIPSWASTLGLLSTIATAVVMSWDSAIFAGVATYLAVFNRDG